jgi:WD40 repeat protein
MADYVDFVSADLDGKIRLWRKQKMIASLVGTERSLFCVQISPDHRFLACASAELGLELWDIATRKRLSLDLQAHKRDVLCVAFSPTDPIVASSASDGSVRFWDLSTYACRAVLSGRQHPVRCMVFSSNGCLVATAGTDKSIRLWDAHSGKCLTVLNWDVHVRGTNCLAFSPDGKQLASCHGVFIYIWNIADSQADPCQELRSGSGLMRCCTYSPDGRILATSENAPGITLWDVTTWTKLADLVGHMASVTCLEFSPNGRTLLSGSADNDIRLWDVAKRKCLAVMSGHTVALRNVLFPAQPRMWSRADHHLFPAEFREVVSELVRGHYSPLSVLSTLPMDVLELVIQHCV